MQAAVVSKKKLPRVIFETNRSSRAGSKSWMLFLPRITYGYKKRLKEIGNESTMKQKISVKVDSS